jgi:hypothetical protein
VSDATGGLELAKKEESQRREVWTQRLGYVCFSVIIAAAMLGLFGSGPLAWASATGSDGRLRIEYQRFARDGGTTELRVAVAPEAVTGDVVEIWIGGGYLESFELQSAIVPEPSSWVSKRDGVAFQFESEAGSSLRILFTLHPASVGSQHAEVGLGDDPPIRFSQFFYS